jgi:glycosyltransferase involved in cell wall biosynthesis
MVKKGYSVTVFVAGATGNKVKEEHINGARVVFIPPAVSGPPSLGYEARLSYSAAEIIGQYLEKGPIPDWLESQDYMGIAYYILQRKWLKYPLFSDLKVVLTLHAPLFLYITYNHTPEYQFPNWWTGEMEKWCMKAADLLISPSKFLISKLKSFPELSGLTIKYLVNPYESQNFESTVNPEKNLVTFFGKLTPQKGLFEVLPEFKKLWDQGAQIKLKVIGGGDHIFQLTGKIANNELKTRYKDYFEKGLISLTGSLNPSEHHEALKSASVVLFPSTVDNLPYAVIEALDMGLIGLASESGGQAEIIDHEKNGFTFSYERKDFKKQLNTALNISPEKRKEFSERAKLKAKKDYDPDRIIEEKDEILSNYTVSTATHFPFLRSSGKSKDEENAASISLSIVIPFYNLAKYLGETLESLKQALKFLSEDISQEVIILDDGSTTSESEAARKLVGFYGFSYKKQENQGLANTRNNGALMAKGRFLFFLDADDTISPEYLPKAISALSAYSNIYFVGCWAQYFEASEQIWPAFSPEPPYLLIHNPINSSALVFERAAFLAAGGNDPEMDIGMEDYETVVRLVSKGYPGVALPDPYWNYRIRKDSMVGNFTKTAELILYQKIAAKNKDLFEKHAVEVNNLLNANGPGINYDNPTRKVIQLRPMDISIFNSRLSSKYLGNGPHVKLLRKVVSRMVRSLIG